MHVIDDTNGPASLIIAAGGLGTRLNSEIPKGLTKFKNSNFLSSVLTKTSTIFHDIVVVCNESNVVLFENFKRNTHGDWKLCPQVGGAGSFYAVQSGLKLTEQNKVVICWVDQIGLDSKIFEKTKKNIIPKNVAFAFPVVRVSNPYVQAIIQDGKLKKWKFKRENEATEEGYTDCGVFGVDKTLLADFLKHCENLNEYKSTITQEVNFLSILIDLQKNNKSTIWEETNRKYTIAVNTPEELEQAEKIL
jgi:bifunctional N-acetylglucosamine-1-phosphate-uridyltransferase/glucosamine-1-phosphate-acetyltransferase GlmU-like protein